MTWTAYLAQVVERETDVGYTITYTDGITKYQTYYQTSSISDDVIKQTARNEINRLNSVVASKGKVTLRQGDIIDTLMVPLVSTPEQLDIIQKQINRNELHRLKDDERDGLKVDATRIAELQMELT